MGLRSFFTPEGEEALMFLKMYTGLGCPKLLELLEQLEQLNGNIHYQIFCDVIIEPTRSLTNYKLLDDIMMELAGKLKIQQLQGILADKSIPYMENLDTMYTDTTCYESEMRYPTDAKLMWEGVEKSYATMCELSSRLGIHRPFGEKKKEKDLVRKELARVRATAMEGSFGTLKEHYDLRRVKARTRRTEILYIFFGIHTANVVQLADRIEQRARLAAA